MVHPLDLWIDTGIDYERRRLHIIAETRTEEGELIEAAERTIMLEIEDAESASFLTVDQTKELIAALEEGLRIILQHDPS
jgi:hypothetical protein